jgi:GTP-binding protein YchF
MLYVGIIGLPNVGKSTLFNALTNNNVLSANYMFTTLEPNRGVVIINDPRLTALAEINKSKRVVPTSIEFVDIPGLVEGASKGEGLGNQFLDSIRNVDAICHVVRCFEDPNISHPYDLINPLRDLETIELELNYADLESIERRISRLEKKVTVGASSEERLEYQTIKKLKENLEDEIPIRNIILTEDEVRIIKSYNFLSQKPVLYLANVDEADLANLTTNKNYQKLLEYGLKNELKVIAISAKLESDLQTFSAEEKQLFLEEIGITQSSLDELISASYELLGLETFFSIVSDETRAWTFKKGMTARECAGLIHSDFMRGFIRAETVKFTDLVLCGSYQKCKEAGKVRLEGKDYLVQDGDILLFRFNV